MGLWGPDLSPCNIDVRICRTFSFFKFSWTPHPPLDTNQIIACLACRTLSTLGSEWFGLLACVDRLNPVSAISPAVSAYTPWVHHPPPPHPSPSSLTKYWIWSGVSQTSEFHNVQQCFSKMVGVMFWKCYKYHKFSTCTPKWYNQYTLTRLII